VKEEKKNCYEKVKKKEEHAMRKVSAQKELLRRWKKKAAYKKEINTRYKKQQQKIKIPKPKINNSVPTNNNSSLIIFCLLMRSLAR